MRKALAIGFIVVVFAALTAAAGPVSGRLSLWAQADIYPFSLTAMGSVLQVDYTTAGWTFASTAITNLSGLDNVYFDVKGVLGGFALRSITDFNAAAAQFEAMIGSAVTSIAGVNLYALFMLDRMTSMRTVQVSGVGMAGVGTKGIITTQNRSGSGLTLGGWGQAGTLSIWAQTRFNMEATSSYIYKYGYNWLLDHFIFETCDVWLTPSGYIALQTDSCTAGWSGGDVYLEMPFSCFTLLTQLSMSCTGFDYVLFEANDIDLGLEVLNLEWIDVMFTTTSKTVNLVFDVGIGETACFTPYFAFEGAGGAIAGVSLKALKLEYAWNGITFKAGDLFDEDGWDPYMNYANPTMRYQGWSWNGELTTLSYCVAKPERGENQMPYDEYLGLVVGSDSCCGGGTTMSAFLWFDRGNSNGLFDWAETRMSLREGIGSNFALTFGMSMTQTGFDWFRLGTEVSW